MDLSDTINDTDPIESGFYWVKKSQDHGWTPALWNRKLWLISGTEGIVEPSSIPGLIVGPKLGPAVYDSGTYLVKFHGLNHSEPKGFIEGKEVVAKYTKSEGQLGVWQIAFSEICLLDNTFDCVEIVSKLPVENY